MLREQAFTELCSECKAPAAGICPKCAAVVCAAHRTEPQGCCQDCAAELFTALAKAGKKTMTVGGVVATAALSVLYLARLGLLPLPVIMLTIVAVFGGISTVAYGALVAPRVAQAKLLGQLQHRELPPATGRE